MTAEEITSEMEQAKKGLRRCQCGSNVVMHYEPGCTFIHCIGDAKTVLAIPEWGPWELRELWENPLPEHQH